MMHCHTAEPAYSRLQGNKKYCLLVEKSTIHPQEEGPIRIRRTEGVVSLVGKNLRKLFKKFQIGNSAICKKGGPTKLLGTELSVSNVVVHYGNYQ